MDFADPNLPVEKVQALYEEGLPNLQIIPLGIRKLHEGSSISKLSEKPNLPETST